MIRGRSLEACTQQYQDLLACPRCHAIRDVRPDNQVFENAKIIELKNLEMHSKITNTNTTLSLEHMKVFVAGKHTLSVGFSEEVEIIGDMYVVSPAWTSSRLWRRWRPRGGLFDDRRGESILYARKMKYTKRERELSITDADIKAIKKFVALPDLVSRLVSMMSPEVYGHNDVKLGLLLLAVGAAPIQKENWYRRHWLNAGLFGDKGTAKTTMAEDAVKLIPGSQQASGQHSTGKGIVAVAEREGESGAFLRTGVATLASNAICTIDEIGNLAFDDQSQFLALMESGVFYFNKMGIRQVIKAKTSFIVTANPMGSGDWSNINSITKDELPLKGQLLDRLDFFFIFRKPRTEASIRDFANNMISLSQKHFSVGPDGKPDFLFLRKYLYYVKKQYGEYDQIDFENMELAEELKNYWSDLTISIANNEAISNRSFESIFRITKAFARLMLKKKVDQEVVRNTIAFVQEMYQKHGVQITEPVDYRGIAYQGICKVIKDYNMHQLWVEGQAKELTEISFNEAR